MSPTDKSILRVLISTRRKKRQLSLVEVATDIMHLKQQFGSMEKVAEVVGISAGMLNQFLKVYQLPQSILELVKNRSIDSISIVNSFSKLSEEDQTIIVSQLENDRLNTMDIRLLLPLRNRFPNETIEDLIEKLKGSENIRISVIKFPATTTTLSSSQISKKLLKLLGENNMISVHFEDEVGIIKLSLEGEKILRQKAKSNRKSLDVFVQSFILQNHA